MFKFIPFYRIFHRMRAWMSRRLLSMAGVQLVSVLLASISFPSTAMAGVVQGRNIVQVQALEDANAKGQDGAFFVYFTAAVSQSPSCATENYRFVVNTGTDGGKALMAILLTAHAQNTPVTVVGSGLCDIWGDTESILYAIN